MDHVSVDDVRAARELLRGVIDVTPTPIARRLSERVGGPVYLKCENLQRTGSFKVRGAYVRIARLSEAERARGVVAASAGNHAQGVALAASMLGCRSTVFMPENASIPKVVATSTYGADVRIGGRDVAEVIVLAEQFAAETGAVMIHPFDHPDVIAGQGTIGLEILEQVPDVRTIVTGTGGGGLLAGIATSLEGRDVKLVGVQAEAAASYRSSLAAGAPVAIELGPTMADGIAVAQPGDIPFEVISQAGIEIRTVSEQSLSGALLHCLERLKVVVEPAGAASIAAIRDAPKQFEPPVVAVLSGGNVDPLLLMRVLRYGMAFQGRFLQLRLWLTDRPGALAELLKHLAESRANIVAIEHRRLDPRLEVDEVEVSLQLETRGIEHREELVARLSAAGYRLVVD